MANRRSASLIGIAGGDRIPNSAMLFIHGANEIAAERLVRPCYSDRYLDGPCKGLDDLPPIIIAARVGDAGMERAVFDDAEFPGLLDSPQSIQCPVNCRHGLARSFHCRDRCNLALDHTSHSDQIDQRLHRRLRQRVQFGPSGIRKTDEGTAALNRLHAPFSAEHGDRLPNDRTAHAETLREGIFRRQLGTGNEIVALDMLNYKARYPLRTASAVMISTCKGESGTAIQFTHHGSTKGDFPSRQLQETNNRAFLSSRSERSFGR